jgi:hypothetical protein
MTDEFDDNDAYQRLRELTRDNVLDELHPALRPDIVAVLDELTVLRERLAKLESVLDVECPTMPFSSCECCNAAARARELIASQESS